MYFNQHFQVGKLQWFAVNCRSAEGAERRLRLESVVGSDQSHPGKLSGRRLLRDETNQSLMIDSAKVPSQTRKTWEALGHDAWLPCLLTGGLSALQDIGAE
jgi:hypothetical protein